MARGRVTLYESWHFLSFLCAVDRGAIRGASCHWCLLPLGDTVPLSTAHKKERECHVSKCTFSCVQWIEVRYVVPLAIVGKAPSRSNSICVAALSLFLVCSG